MADERYVRAWSIAERFGPSSMMWQIASARAVLWRGVDEELFKSERARAVAELDGLASTISDIGRRKNFLSAAQRLLP